MYKAEDPEIPFMHSAKPGERTTLVQKPALPPRERQRQVLQESVTDIPCPAHVIHV